MDRLNFNHLYYFSVVAREGSVKIAAEKLHVSQPTISDQIKLLEEHLQSRLFDRRNRALILTKKGEVVLSFAEQIFNLASELTSTMRNDAAIPKKSVDIGITQHMSPYFLYDRILPLYESGEVSVNIIEEARHILLAELQESNIDLVFTNSKDNLTPALTAHRVGVNRTFAVAHKKYKHYKRGFPQRLGELPFFHYTNESFLKYEIDLFFSKHSIAPKVIGQAEDVDLLKVITEQGLAFTILPEVAKNRLLLNEDVCTLGELKDLQTSVWVLTRRGYKGPGLQLIDRDK